ncbi:hypothetical protein yrohd0001_9250 [Yersinia rohdei ATCC 43380]|nr:hypothetical protein yrohd0001_9250 [Yersinia rohdei ATCC 43380]
MVERPGNESRQSPRNFRRKGINAYKTSEQGGVGGING